MAEPPPPSPAEPPQPEAGPSKPSEPPPSPPSAPSSTPPDGTKPDPKNTRDSPQDQAEPSDDAESLIGEASSSPGQNAETAGQRREALDDWTVGGIAGRDFVGRDKTVTTYIEINGRRDTPIRLYEVVEDDLAQTLFAFAVTDGAEHLAQIIGQHPVTLVRGARGSGRTSAALWALNRLDPPLEKIFHLDPATNLRDLSGGQVDERTALVLSDEAGSPSIAVNRFDLDRVAAELHERGCRLVITVNSATRLPQYGVQVAVAELGDPPTAGEVLSRHLHFRLGLAQRARAEEILADPELPELIDTYLGPGSRILDATVLAGYLADCPAGTSSLLAAVGPRMATRQEDDYAEWFAGLPDLRTRCMAIALSVLGGQSHETVSDAAEALAQQIDPRARDREAREAPSGLFGNSRQRELDTLNAITEFGRQWTRHGDTAIEVVRFAKPGFGAQLFLHVWEQYREVRKPITAWLDIFAGHPAISVRIRAATAVGMLTRQIFDHMYGALLMPWATTGGKDPGHRERLQDAAATALGVAGSSPEIRPLVRSLVVEWEQDRRINLQCTAARSYGTSLGLEDPDYAIRALARLAKSQNLRVQRVVAFSLGELIAQDPEVFGGRVLQLLYDWAHTPKEQLDATGRFAFLILAADLVIMPEADPGADDDEISWPTWLWLGIGDRARRHQMVWLWWATLNSRDLSTPARRVLTRWAERCDGTEAGRAQMQVLLREVACDDRTTGIVRLVARDWADTDGVAPRLGDWVTKTLRT